MERDPVLEKVKTAPADFVAPGLHLLVDFYQAQRLKDEAFIEHALRDAVKACGAKLLSLHLHSFGPDAGITGVAVLAESHISIHTWPEIDYAAFDIFMCGSCDPHRAVPVLERHFQPGTFTVSEHRRGKISV